MSNMAAETGTGQIILHSHVWKKKNKTLGNEVRL